MKNRISDLSTRAQKSLGWEASDSRNLKYACRKLSPLLANEMLNKIEDLLDEYEPQAEPLTVCQEMYREACQPLTRPVASFDWNGAYVGAAILGHAALALVAYIS